MKSLLLALTFLLTGCAIPPSEPAATKSAENYRRDPTECERQAALSTAGSKARAFDSCMRARGNVPNR
jgi:hypothetical protein